jgi:hypothetical protein
VVSTGKIEDLLDDDWEVDSPDFFDMFLHVDEERERRAAAGLWLTKDGREMTYSTMDDRHLLNIVMMLRRKAQLEAEVAASTEGLTLGPDGWQACEPPEMKYLLVEGKSRGGMLEAALDVVTSGNAFDEDVIRRAVPRVGKAIARQKAKAREKNRPM